MPDGLDTEPCTRVRKWALHSVRGVHDPAHVLRPAPLPIPACQPCKDEWLCQRERLSDPRRQRRRAPRRGFELPFERSTLRIGSRVALGVTCDESSAQRDRIFRDRPDGMRSDARSDRARAPRERSGEERGATGVGDDLHGAPMVHAPRTRADARIWGRVRDRRLRRLYLPRVGGRNGRGAPLREARRHHRVGDVVRRRARRLHGQLRRQDLAPLAISTPAPSSRNAGRRDRSCRGALSLALHDHDLATAKQVFAERPDGWSPFFVMRAYLNPTCEQDVRWVEEVSSGPEEPQETPPAPGG